MARLALDLSQFRSAGVYTIEVDQSERITVTTQSLRLVPGFSRIGPFNTPVFIRSTRDRIRYFGEVDSKLERRGSFFHRSIDTCLLQSPVFAINLLKVDGNPQNSVDLVDAVGLSIDSSVANNNVESDLYVNFFNRERFWRADPDYLNGVLANKYGVDSESTPFLQIANTGTRKLSFIVRKARNIQGYSVLAKDWYGSKDNIPFEWIRPFDLMRDYFIEIIALEGDWTNYTELSTDPIFSQYFTADGIRPERLREFINLQNINLIGSWTGTIIPEFRDQTGAGQYIEDIVNASTPITGVLLNINKEALDQLIWDEDSEQWEFGDGSSIDAADFIVDLVGHNLIEYADAPTNLIQKNFLSYNIDTSSGQIHNEIEVELYGDGVTSGKKFYLVDEDDKQFISTGTFVQKDPSYGILGVTIVTGKSWTSDVSTATSPDGVYIIETAEPVLIDNDNIITQKPINEISDHYKLIPLDGLTITNNHKPGFNEDGAPSVEDGVEKIYGMLEDRGILRGLTNPDMIQYRYIVDTMSYGLRPNLGGKVYLSRLAKKRGMTTALLNAPSIAQFAASQNPYFTDTFIPGVDPKPIFSTEWIAEGGNPDMPRSFRFSFPDEDNGARYAGIFGPFLRYEDGGRTKYVPPAADVSNSFVRKFLGGDPFAIVANRNGIISNPNLAGVEYNIDQEDRDYLEPIGYNSIIERPETGEIVIYSNRTSFQNVRSDYNFLHVRELLNTIEIQVESVLKDFVFDFNNPVSRLNIVNSITPILESVKDAGALFDYEIVMDEENNPRELIDDGFAIVDIGVWINKGMEKIINRITVNRLGTTSTGGFTTV